MNNFWKEMESFAASAAGAVVPALLNAYLNKSVGVPGAPAMTLGNVGAIAGAVAAASVLQHIGGLQAAADGAKAESAGLAAIAGISTNQAPVIPINQGNVSLNSGGQSSL